jgi:acyl phosphate:glycerol-3-phosphate acyltransferase
LYHCRMLELGSKSLLAYLLGSLIGSLIVGRLRGGVDIRTLGSGNAGGTNALRTQGVGFAIWVMLIDIGKGWLATAWLPGANIPGIGYDATIARDWLVAACATGAVLGHVYPVWYGFRGGKGAATLIGVLLGIAPIAAAPVLLVWISVVALTGYVGLATMIAVAAFPVYLMLSSDNPSDAYLTFGVAMIAFVCYTHRANIERMRAGTENRARRLWLLKPR